MKTLGKFWYVFLILGIVVGLINPRVGIISLININELFFIGILIFISFVIKNIRTEGFRESFIFNLVKLMMTIFSYMIPIFLFIAIIAAELGFYCASFTSDTMFPSISIFSADSVVCHILFAVTVLINILSLVSCLGRTRSIDIN